MTDTESTASEELLAPDVPKTDTSDAPETPKGIYYDPENPDSAKDIYKALGVPESADKYEFNLGENVTIDDAQMGTFKEIALKNNLTQTQAEALLKFDMERQETIANQQIDALKSTWGADYDKNINLARNAFSKAGLEPSDIDRAAAAIGHDKVLKLLSVAGAEKADGTLPGQTLSKPNVQDEFNKWATPENIRKAFNGEPAAKEKWQNYLSQGVVYKP